jgi:hypothetical protein
MGKDTVCRVEETKCLKKKPAIEVINNFSIQMRRWKEDCRTAPTS